MPRVSVSIVCKFLIAIPIARRIILSAKFTVVFRQVASLVFDIYDKHDTESYKAFAFFSIFENATRPILQNRARLDIIYVPCLAF